jgi:hypothetical protein
MLMMIVPLSNAVGFDERGDAFKAFDLCEFAELFATVNAHATSHVMIETDFLVPLDPFALQEARDRGRGRRRDLYGFDHSEEWLFLM